MLLIGAPPSNGSAARAKSLLTAWISSGTCARWTLAVKSLGRVERAEEDVVVGRNDRSRFERGENPPPVARKPAAGDAG